MKQKKILFINRQAPYGTALAQEALDILLMASTFNQEISVAFIDDGILQIKKGQTPDHILAKNFSLAFKALPLYEIQNVYVEEESLASSGLKTEDLLIPVAVKNSAELANIIQQQDIIFNF